MVLLQLLVACINHLLRFSQKFSSVLVRYIIFTKKGKGTLFMPYEAHREHGVNTHIFLELPRIM